MKSLINGRKGIIDNCLIKIFFKELIFKIIDNNIDKIISSESFEYISDKDFNTFINALKLSKSVKTLKFKEINLSPDKVNKLTYFLQNNKNINNLSITGYNLEKYNIIQIINNNKNITKFSLNLTCFSFNELYYKVFYNFIEQNITLKQLSIITISNNYYSDDNINFIIETLFNSLINNKYLETIKFKMNKYGFIIEGTDIRYELIIKLLQNNNRIKNLYLKKCKHNYDDIIYYDDIAVNSFLKYLQTNNSLKKLKISSTKFNPRLLALLVKNNKTLEYLDLLNSRIKNIDLMIEYLKTNTTLKYLNLKNIIIKDKFYDKEAINDAIKEVLECNKNIKIDY